MKIMDPEITERVMEWLGDWLSAPPAEKPEGLHRLVIDIHIDQIFPSLLHAPAAEVMDVSLRAFMKITDMAASAGRCYVPSLSISLVAASLAGHPPYAIAVADQIDLFRPPELIVSRGGGAFGSLGVSIFEEYRCSLAPLMARGRLIPVTYRSLRFPSDITAGETEYSRFLELGGVAPSEWVDRSAESGIFGRAFWPTDWDHLPVTAHRSA